MIICTAEPGLFLASEDPLLQDRSDVDTSRLLL